MLIHIGNEMEPFHRDDDEAFLADIIGTGTHHYEEDARIKHTHFYRGMDYIWIDFDHFWILFHQDALDKSLVSVWSM